MLNYYKANYPRPPYEEGREFPPVACRVLMFHGLKDMALLPGALNDTWKWVERDLTLITVPDAGHWVHHEARELVTRNMIFWLTN
jgi:pimeloyl-ACP methyl ester carboxylesterase